MKTFFATLVAVAFADHDHHQHQSYEHDDGADYHGNLPSSDFDRNVHEFNAWATINDQHAYEERLETEAELMIALEALREALVEIDHDIDDLDSCVSDNDDGISDNDHGRHHCDDEISENEDEISDQEDRVKDLQYRCRAASAAGNGYRNVLVLHCQQFAFATDMVGACADILTCADTRLSYRADVFTGGHMNDHHDHDDGHYGHEVDHYGHDDHSHDDPQHHAGPVFNEPVVHDHTREHHYYG